MDQQAAVMTRYSPPVVFTLNCLRFVQWSKSKFAAHKALVARLEEEEDME